MDTRTLAGLSLDFLAEIDADKIQAACKGLGTDDTALTGVLCCRSKEQIGRINEVYKKKYGSTLLDQIRSETSGDYKRFLKQMIADKTTADADSLFKAMDGAGTTERVLSEILVTATNAEIIALKDRYQAKFDRPLIDHIKSETSGDYGKFLLQLLQAERQETAAPDPALAATQAAQLHEAAKGWGCNESVFIEILGKASVEQTDLIEAAYESAHGKSLKKLIEGEMGGDLEWAMTLRLENVLDAQCWLLRYAMKGIGTNEDTIARVIGGASKDDVQAIHRRFDQKYSRSLAADLESELSGNLKKAVLLWLTEPLHPSARADAAAGEPEPELQSAAGPIYKALGPQATQVEVRLYLLPSSSVLIVLCHALCTTYRSCGRSPIHHRTLIGHSNLRR